MDSDEPLNDDSNEIGGDVDLEWNEHDELCNWTFWFFPPELHKVIEDDWIDGITNEDWEVSHKSIADIKFARKDPILRKFEEKQHQFKIKESQWKIKSRYNTRKNTTMEGRWKNRITYL